uniref:TBC1 domain family member 10B n=1 Tax=Leptobrachium leishanense TaxID=445787 RepID=A0A8C5Q1X7_9ANUR
MEPPQGPRPVPPPRRPSGERRATSPPGGEKRVPSYTAAQSHGTAAQSHGAAAQSHGTAAQSHGTAAQSQDTAAQSHGTAAQSQDTAAQSHGAATQSQDTAAQSHGTAAQSHGTAAQSHGTAAQSLGAAAQSLGAAAQSLGAVTQSHGTVTQSYPAVQSQESTPSSYTSISSHETAQNSNDSPSQDRKPPSYTAAPSHGTTQSYTTMPNQERAPPSYTTAPNQDSAPSGQDNTQSQGAAPSHSTMHHVRALPGHTAAPSQGRASQSHGTALSYTASHQESAQPIYETVQSHQTAPWHDTGAPQTDQTAPPGFQTVPSDSAPPSSELEQNVMAAHAKAHRDAVTLQVGDAEIHLVMQGTSNVVPASQPVTFKHSAPGWVPDAALERDGVAQNYTRRLRAHQSLPPCGAPPDRDSMTWSKTEPQDAVSPSVVSLAMERIKQRNPLKSSTAMAAPESTAVPPAREWASVTNATKGDLIPQSSNNHVHAPSEQPSVPRRESRSPHPYPDTAPPISTGKAPLEPQLSIGEFPVWCEATPVSNGESPSLTTPGEASTRDIPPHSNPRSSALTTEVTLSASTAGAAPLSTEGIPPHSTTVAAPLSTGGTPPLTSIGAALLSTEGIPPLSNTGAAPLSAGDAPPRSNTRAVSLSTGGTPPLTSTGTALLSADGTLPLTSTGAAPLSAGSAPTLTNTGAAPFSAGSAPPLTSTGVAPLSAGGTPSLTSRGGSQLSVGSTPPLTSTGTALLSADGTLPLTEAAHLSTGSTPPLTSTAVAPDSSVGTPPLTSTGAALLSTGGLASLTSTGAAPLSTGDTASLSSTGAAPLATGGLSNSSPGASSVSRASGSKLSPVRVLDPQSPHRNKSKPPLPIPPRSNLYPGPPPADYDSSLRHETASLASYRSKAPAPDTLSYLDSVSLMSGTMESLSMADDASSLGSDSEINGMAYRKTDKYGFLGGTPHGNGESAIPVEIARQRELKWLDMFSHWDKWIARRFQKVKLRCRKGIPSSLRAKAWQLLSNSHELLVKNPGKFEEMERQSGDPKWLDVIEKDLHRQFPFHEMFAARGGHGQQDLYRILKAYTIYRPEEGYCQAQAPVAAVLLMHMPAEQAFWCLVQICDKYLPGYYSAGLEAIQLDGEIFFALLRRISAPAYRHLRKFKIDPILYMTEWFMCIFSRTLPWSSVLRVWDMFFCEGVKIIFRVGLVLLKHTLGSADKLRSCQGMYETMEKLRSLPTQCMHEDTLLPEVSALPVADALIERESNTQLRKWRENRGELQYQPSRRRHGSRHIYEEKLRLNPALSGSRLSLSSLRRPSPPPTPALALHPESVVVSEGLRPALPSPTSNKAPLVPPKSENKKAKEKEREEEKRREKEERELQEREKRREKEERELEKRREKEQKRAQKEREKNEAKQKKERKFSFRRKEQSSPVTKGGKGGTEGEEGAVHDTYF